MGQMDRDYWRDRYNRRTNGGKDPATVNLHTPQASVEQPARKANELGFLGKFITTLTVLLISAIVYRYMR